MSDDLRTLASAAVERVRRHLARHVYPHQRRFAALLLDRRIETAEEVGPEQLGGAVPDQIHYVASGWFFLRRGLHGYRVGPDDVFVDFGSGKGRLVYQAARHPFGRVVGIELHDELTKIARANIERNRSRLRCQNIELITGDLTTTPVPDDMTVAYLFNPVTGEAFRRLIENVVASLRRRPRRLRLMYANPVEADAVQRTGQFSLIARSRGPRLGCSPWLYVYESAAPRL